jgi:hypothetical protein
MDFPPNSLLFQSIEAGALVVSRPAALSRLRLVPAGARQINDLGSPTPRSPDLFRRQTLRSAGEPGASARARLKANYPRRRCTTAILLRTSFNDEIPALAPEVVIIELGGLRMAKLEQRLASMPDDTVIYFTTMIYEGDRPAYVPATRSFIFPRSPTGRSLVYSASIGDDLAEVESRHRMAELAHMNRTATVGELSASFAQELIGCDCSKQSIMQLISGPSSEWGQNRSFFSG